LKQFGIYFGLLVLLSMILFSSYLCCHRACRVEQSRYSMIRIYFEQKKAKENFFSLERITVRRIRQVQTWLKSKPSMWIHNLAAAEKIPLTVYDVNSGVTRTTLDPPLDIIECYLPIMNEQKPHPLTRPLLPPPPPPPPLPINLRMPFCNDDQSEQIYEIPDAVSWHIDV